MLDSIIQAIATAIGVFIAMQLHWKATEVRSANNGKLVMKDMAKPITDLLEDTKPEFMLPMDEEEYEAYMEKQSEHGQLINKVLGKWKSKDNKSQS